MTVLGRRNKTRWIKLMKRRGLTYRRGKLWYQWRWSLKLGVPKSHLPVYHADYEGDFDGMGCDDVRKPPT